MENSRNVAYFRETTELRDSTAYLIHKFHYYSDLVVHAVAISQQSLESLWVN